MRHIRLEPMGSLPSYICQAKRTGVGNTVPVTNGAWSVPSILALSKGTFSLINVSRTDLDSIIGS